VIVYIIMIITLIFWFQFYIPKVLRFIIELLPLTVTRAKPA